MAEAISEVLLTFKIDNTKPVAIYDLTSSLSAFAQAYEEYLGACGQIREGENVKLYVHDLRTGSIIAVLQAIAEQGRLFFGESGLVPAMQSAFEHSERLGGFVTHLNDIVSYFLGVSIDQQPPTRKEAGHIIDVLEPVAKDPGGVLSIRVDGNASIGSVNVYIDSHQANAVQNRARHYLGPMLPENHLAHDELLTLHQVRGDPKAKTGDRGVIASISPLPTKLLFASEDVKNGILQAPENPFQRVFVIDAEVKTVEGKIAAYKVLCVKESFEKP